MRTSLTGSPSLLKKEQEKSVKFATKSLPQRTFSASSVGIDFAWIVRQIICEQRFLMEWQWDYHACSKGVVSSTLPMRYSSSALLKSKNITKWYKMMCELESRGNLSGAPDQDAIRLSGSQGAATGELSVSAASRLVLSVEIPIMRQIVKSQEQQESFCITLMQGYQSVLNAESHCTKCQDATTWHATGATLSGVGSVIEWLQTIASISEQLIYLVVGVCKTLLKVFVFGC